MQSASGRAREAAEAVAESEALQREGAGAVAAAAAVRLGAVALFLPLLAVLHAVGAPGWDTYMAPMAVFGVVAAVAFVVRHKPAVTAVGPYLFVLDVALVFELQRRSLPSSPFPAGVAGFSLGLFALLGALSSSTLHRRAPWVVLAAASTAQCALMSLAGVGPGAQVAAVLVLGLVTWTQRGVSRRLMRMVRGLASAEADWLRKHEQVNELTEARSTIERLWNEANRRNGELVALQDDKESLAALLVHDLRAPLGVVRANLDFIRSELPEGLDEEVGRALDEGRTVTERLTGMIGDLLNIARLERGGLDLALQVQPSRALFQRLQRDLSAQGRSRKLQVTMSCDDVLLEADHGLLARTLENLASNALRYAPTGGRIHLDARGDATGVVFSVSNDGPVIPVDRRDTLFDKFVQGGSAQENRRAGWGLGLYFCKLCVEAHRGSIAVEDRAGWATSFVVRLPGVVAEQQAA